MSLSLAQSWENLALSISSKGFNEILQNIRVDLTYVSGVGQSVGKCSQIWKE